MSHPAENDALAFEEKHPGCCPRCGWHLSSHMRSQYGLDCPWGLSPAAKVGDLPPRVIPPEAGKP